MLGLKYSKIFHYNIKQIWFCTWVCHESTLRSVTMDLAFSLTLMPWSLPSSIYWKSFSVEMECRFSRLCSATYRIYKITVIGSNRHKTSQNKIDLMVIKF